MSATMLWTLLGTYFTWWLLTQVLERWAGLVPQVFTAEEVERLDLHIDASLGDGAAPKETALARRVTRSLDPAGAFRIQNPVALL